MRTKQLFQSNKILNVYKLNILNVATFMCKVHLKAAPNVFLSRFQKPYHFYPTRFSELNYLQPIHNFKTSNTQFQLEDYFSRTAPKRNKLLTLHKFNSPSVLIQQIGCWGLNDKTKLVFCNPLLLLIDVLFSWHM